MPWEIYPWIAFLGTHPPPTRGKKWVPFKKIMLKFKLQG
jgi:hypothetical protein